MILDKKDSTWAIISSPIYSDLLKEKLVNKSYRGYIIDSIINESLVPQNTYLIYNHRNEDDFRFDMINIMNEDWFNGDFIYIKYESEPIVYKLYKNGYEEKFGKFKWGMSESVNTFVFNNYPFTFSTNINDYNMSYTDYKKQILYK
jgi:hypothetical protein